MARSSGLPALLKGALVALLAASLSCALLAPGPALATDEVAADGEVTHAFRADSEKFEFQAEVSRLMDIIINSLYSNKDIFLRELISNGSDAMDKIRFQSLTEPDALGEGEAAKLDVHIKIDADNNILSIRDKGIGMTKADLINHLGTIAKSGTSAFLDQMAAGGDMNLIGQFGVGFYSVYLVADFVEVVSKHNDDEQYIWESMADGNFAVSKDTEGEPLGRGTEIRLHLKEEAMEYLKESKIEDMVKKYSEFINFPIYLWKGHEVSEEVPVEDEGEEGAEGEADAEGEGDGEDDGPEMKTVTRTEFDWELINDNKAIWLRNPKEVDEQDYLDFYKAMSKDYQEPLGYTHFTAEGDVEFKAILFIGKKAPSDLFDNYYSKAAALKLYVRRVFISDEFDELMPKYLAFIRGIVDSDTLPLNVSREMLQQHSSLRTIKKKLVRKALDMIRKMAEDEMYEDEGEGEGEGEGASASDEGEGKYSMFWKEYGKSIKLGIIEDSSNRIRLAKLLRFYTSSSPDELVSLEEYVDNMMDGQKSIYYLTCADMDECKNSPFVEQLLKKGYEVIYFTDAIDEYVMQNLSEFDDHSFQNASKEDLKLDVDKNYTKKVKKMFKPLTSAWKTSLIQAGEDIDSVKVSDRLTTSVATVVTAKYGWSANMERIMKAQALSGDNSQASYMKAKKTLEINPKAPLVRKMLEMAEEDDSSDELKAAMSLVYDSALLESGFTPEKPQAFSGRLFKVLATSMDIEDIEVDPDFEFEFEPEPEPEPAADEPIVDDEPKDEL